MKSLEKRFGDKIYPEPNTGCWLWGASTNKGGYGTIGYLGRIITAHRLSYILYRGEISNGLHVLHTCDVRCCVNPNHLFLGTNYDNVIDMHKKGRYVTHYGEMNGNSKLTEMAVRVIKEAIRAGFSSRSIGAYFHINHSHVKHIKHGRLWKRIIV